MPYLSGLAAVIIWGLVPSLIKTSFASMSVIEFVFYRFLLAALLFLPLLPIVIKKIKVVPTGLFYRYAASAALLFFVQTTALSQVPVAWYVMVFSICPVLFVLFGRYSLAPLTWACMLLAILGVIGFILSSHHLTAVHLSSLGLLALSMLLWVDYSLIVNKMQKHLSSLHVIALTAYLCLFVYFVAWVSIGPITLPSSSSVWLSLLMTGWGLPIALLFYVYGLKHLPVFTMSLQYLEPIFGLFFAMLIFSISLTTLQYSLVLVITLCVTGIGYATKEVVA